MTPRIVQVDVPVRPAKGPNQSLRPINGSQPVEMSSDSLLESDDRINSTMIWECSPGAFHWDYHFDEWALILQGHATLNHNGETKELKVGDIVQFRAGSTVEWQIHERVRKVAWLRKKGARAIVSKAKYWVKSLLASAPALCLAQLVEPIAPLVA